MKNDKALDTQFRSPAASDQHPGQDGREHIVLDVSALRQKSAPVITGMHAPGKMHPAAGENQFGNTKHMLS